MLKKKTKSAASFTPIRFGLLCVAILGCLGLLLVRVGWLQIISPDNLVKQEDMRSLREEPVAVERGMISDREGRPLAVSVPVSAIWIDPQTTMEKGGVGYGPRWQAMAEALHLNLGELAQRVQSHPHARFSIWRVRSIPSRQSGLINCICRASTCAMNRDGSTRRATWLPICWALPMLIIRASKGWRKALTPS